MCVWGAVTVIGFIGSRSEFWVLEHGFWVRVRCRQRRGADRQRPRLRCLMTMECQRASQSCIYTWHCHLSVEFTARHLIEKWKNRFVMWRWSLCLHVWFCFLLTIVWKCTFTLQETFDGWFYFNCYKPAENYFSKL